jgi:hypothetical protein
MSHCHLFSHTVSHTWHCYYDEVGFSLFVEGRSVTARYEAVCFGDDANVDPAAADQPPPPPAPPSSSTACRMVIWAWDMGISGLIQVVVRSRCRCRWLMAYGIWHLADSRSLVASSCLLLGWA